MFGRLKSTLNDFLRQADLVLLALCCVASGFGLVLIYSATRFLEKDRLILVQSVAVVLGVFCYILLSTVDIEAVAKKWRWILAFNILFIALLIPFGVGEGGNRAWLVLPGVPVSIGPAEVVKISFTVLLAKQLDWLKEEHHDLRSIRSVGMLGGHVLLITGLYYGLSSDMGNTLMFLLIFIVMAFVAGVALRWFFLGGTAVTVAVGAAWYLDLMPSYMKERFITLFDHGYDPTGVGWHQTRSLLSLGSGQLTGQGYLQGTQTQSPYSASLPYRWTDFIFSVAGEEFGFLGCALIIVLLAAIIIRCLLVARRAKTTMSSYICVGLAAMLIFQTVENIGMCLFVMPVIGLTLPFFSYGGSSIVTLFCAMGIVSGIKKRSRPGWLRN